MQNFHFHATWEHTYGRNRLDQNSQKVLVESFSKRFNDWWSLALSRICHINLIFCTGRTSLVTTSRTIWIVTNGCHLCKLQAVVEYVLEIVFEFYCWIEAFSYQKANSLLYKDLCCIIQETLIKHFLYVGHWAKECAYITIRKANTFSALTECITSCIVTINHDRHTK